MSWVFPSLEETEGTVRILASRAQLPLRPETMPPQNTTCLSRGGPQFTYCRWRGTWYYCLARARKPAEEPDVVHAAVSAFALVLGSAHFYPERFQAMLEVLLRGFEAEEGSPLALLQRVLSVATKGSATAPGGGKFVSSAFLAGPTDAQLDGVLRVAVRRLGPAGCAIAWGAMMLRARVAILADDPSTCLALGRSLPLLAWHRRRWEVLHPLCGLDEPEEVQDLEQAGTYVAGFTDPKILNHPELYDVLIDTRGMPTLGVAGEGAIGTNEGDAVVRCLPAAATWRRRRI